MKKIKITAAILSLAILSACNSGQSVQTSETVSETEASAVTTSATTATTTETETETEPAEIAEENEIEYVEIPLYYYHEFIDFDFIEDYQGTTNIGDLADKAVEFLKTTDEYVESMKNISEFSDGEFSDYIADGIIVPKFRTAYPNDYDGDGRTETFIAVDMPVHYDSNILTSFYIYADCGGKMTLLDVSGKPDENVTFLNYGRDKQIAFGGGMSPYGSVCYLYGVEEGDPVLLYGEQAGLEKRACFLRSHGFQATERFMYYDTITRKYIQIASVQIPLKNLKALDASGSLNSVFEKNGDQISAWIVGRKYYCIKVMFEFADVYTYDNGTFTLMTDPPVGLNIPDSIMPCVKDIDMDEAIAGMKPPVEPYVEVSEGNEFIDYNFILNYQGTTDIGDLAEKAVDFLKTTEYYSESMKNIAEFKDEEFSDYIEDGVIVPKLHAAYPADYDSDGKIETFIVVDMPSVIMPSPDIWNFLLFADSNGNIYPDVIDFYEGCSASMLDYGKSKHLIFSGWDGFHSYASIYGVKDNKPVTLYDHCPGGYFRKTDCFLSVFGLQGLSDFMYFDTAALEYRVIKGVELSHAEMAELDVSNTLCSDFGEENIDELPDYVEFHFIKPNYYLLDWGFPGSVLFTYENGVFTRVEDSNITRSSNGSHLDAIAEFDIDKAVAEMKPVSDPFSPISKDSEFIDFEFIKNYQGTTDIGDLADKAVQYINNSNAFEGDRKDADKFSDEKFSAFFDDYGNLIPKLLTAYPNDYDGDGKTETFIIMEMPLYMWNRKTAVIRAYLLFADSDGKMDLCMHLDGFDPQKDAVLLNYGKYKHILFYDNGDYEDGTGICIYGAANSSSEAVYHYGGVGSLKKDGCFLSVSDNRYHDYFMFFDTATQEYITLLGKNYGSSMPAPLGTNQNAEIKPVQK